MEPNNGNFLILSDCKKIRQRITHAGCTEFAYIREGAHVQKSVANCYAGHAITLKISHPT
ncbi:hypothetical protein RUM43_001483 [Polyplax serrata]|uniref:Uncharacterized protein n=1 Tax=Polyplax serrata TaxID=468196 RepID=A0AAN8XU01_POLSC